MQLQTNKELQKSLKFKDINNPSMLKMKLFEKKSKTPLAFPKKYFYPFVLNYKQLYSLLLHGFSSLSTNINMLHSQP